MASKLGNNAPIYGEWGDVDRRAETLSPSPGPLSGSQPGT
jgi:hypothetical protein